MCVDFSVLWLCMFSLDSGNRYEGAWKDNKIEGHGKLFMINGVSFQHKDQIDTDKT